MEQSILGLRDRAQDRVLRLSHDLHQNPEIAWEEHESAARVAGELDDAGFTVESNYVGLATAFRAHRGSGPVHLALCAEYDALPGLGHACGHNVIAAISTGAAVALGPFVDDLGITLARCMELRLLDGLQAAIVAGGEAGPVHSAGLQVVEDVPWPVTDLRIDWHDDPIGELRRLWSVWAPQKQDYRTRGLDPTEAPSYGVPGDL